MKSFECSRQAVVDVKALQHTTPNRTGACKIQMGGRAEHQARSIGK